jgi:hypothetical protein
LKDILAGIDQALGVANKYGFETTQAIKTIEIIGFSEKPSGEDLEALAQEMNNVVSIKK